MITRQLWSAFKEGMAIARIPLSWFETVTAWLNGMSIEGGRVERTPRGIVIYPYVDSTPAWAGSTSLAFSFKTVDDAGGEPLAAPTATMTPGDVRLGPDTLIEWADFMGESTTVSPTASNTTWYVWLVIDVEAETVAWYEGATVTALDSTEQLTKVNKELVKLTLTWTADPTPLGTITEVKHLQLGDVFIPGAAG